MHENNLCKPAPANLLRKTKSLSFAVQSLSIQGAMVSGRRAAEAVLLDLRSHKKLV